MASTTQDCIIKSVTLAPNEPFTLPAGAEIISATDINSLSSTCSLPTKLEEPACYSLMVQESISDGGDAAYNNVYVTGMNLSGTHYPFSSNIDFPNINDAYPESVVNAFIARLNEVGIGPLFSDWSGYADDIPNSGDAASVTFLCFKVPPSIGDNLSFTAYGDQDGSAPSVPFIVPVLPSQVMLDTYLSTYPTYINACGCN